MLFFATVQQEHHMSSRSLPLGFIVERLQSKQVVVEVDFRLHGN